GSYSDPLKAVLNSLGDQPNTTTSTTPSIPRISISTTPSRANGDAPTQIDFGSSRFNSDAGDP
ncbi:MAG TPA: hypothetical protein VE222_04640, partial [Nitrospiraceae bacterium]|nr:hypothetical protein [Nitrospiraceae bacterium]